MASFTLTDLATDTWLDSFRCDASGLGLARGPAWSVTKRTLRGGRREGVDLVVVDNGALRVGDRAESGDGALARGLPGGTRWAGVRRSSTGR